MVSTRIENGVGDGELEKVNEDKAVVEWLHERLGEKVVVTRMIEVKTIS